MADITYCTNKDCPFKKCERHYSKASRAALIGTGYVSVADYSGVCREYIGYLVDKSSKKGGTDNG